MAKGHNRSRLSEPAFLLNVQNFHLIRDTSNTNGGHGKLQQKNKNKHFSRVTTYTASTSSRFSEVRLLKAVMPSMALSLPWSYSIWTIWFIRRGMDCNFFATDTYLFTVSLFHSDVSLLATNSHAFSCVPTDSTISARTWHFAKADNPITLRFFSSSSKCPEEIKTALAMSMHSLTKCVLLPNFTSSLCFEFWQASKLFEEKLRASSLPRKTEDHVQERLRQPVKDIGIVLHPEAHKACSCHPHGACSKHVHSVFDMTDTLISLNFKLRQEAQNLKKTSRVLQKQHLPTPLGQSSLL